MLFLNLKKAERGKEDIISIKIGKDQVNEVKSAKLLGITLTNNQTWNEQICGTGGVISCLNQRFYLLKRLKNKINQKNLLTVTDSIFISKIRYGIQLYGKIRWSENDELNGLLEEIQKVQNKLARWLNGVSLKDRKRTST